MAKSSNKLELLELPFYPVCSVDQRPDGVTVWWFEKDFSQITYGPHPDRGRNACVLIVLLTASKIAQREIPMPPRTDENVPNEGLVKCFAESILQGIVEYSRLLVENKLATNNLSIPEACQALNSKINNIHEWVHCRFLFANTIINNYLFQKSYLYVVGMAENLHNFIQEGIHAWNYKSLAKKHFLFIILIADSRAVLIVIDQLTQTATFIDSHPHSFTHGSCISQCSLQNIRALCKWICKMYKDLYNSTPTCFELSYFQVRQRTST